jgi:hypothetical protein
LNFVIPERKGAIKDYQVYVKRTNEATQKEETPPSEKWDNLSATQSIIIAMGETTSNVFIFLSS